jgi:hypothetical protein
MPRGCLVKRCDTVANSIFSEAGAVMRGGAGGAGHVTRLNEAVTRGDIYYIY